MPTKPQKLRVFVDLEEVLVSFYDVARRARTYSFTAIGDWLERSRWIHTAGVISK